jgi:hypothetical protein
MLRRALPVVVTALVVLWPASAHAQPEVTGEPNDQVVLAGDVLVPKGRIVGEVVVFSGSASVAGVVDGDVVVLHGPVSVSGQVSGDVVALDGPIRLAATAQVGRDVLGSGIVRVMEGAQVQGQVRKDVRFTLSGPLGALGLLLVPAAVAVSVLLTMLVLLLLAPRGVERVAVALRTAPFASVGWGLLLWIVSPALAVVALATILGLPFGLALLLGLGLWWLVGLAWAWWGIGRLVVRRSRTGALFAGWGIGAVLGLVPFLNVAWWASSSVVGVGAMTVAAWRGRGTGRHRLGAAPWAEEPAPSRLAPAAPALELEPSAHPPETPLAED